MVVKRTINSVTRRFVEYLSLSDFGSDVTDAFFVDSGLTSSGASASTISGLDHLVGQTVSISEISLYKLDIVSIFFELEKNHWSSICSVLF